MHTPDSATVPAPRTPPAPGGLTYGRSRLLLGVSGVGCWVVLASVALAFDGASGLNALAGVTASGAALGVVGLAIAIALIQAPFDLFGGYILPSRHARSQTTLGAYSRVWLRGVAVHTALFAAIGLAMLAAAFSLGGVGMALVGVVASAVLLAVRTRLARVAGGWAFGAAPEGLAGDVAVFSSRDVGCTGGIEGVLSARRHLIPAHWRDTLDDNRLDLAIERRRTAVGTGLWLRGRIGSLLYTWAGLALAGIVAGSDAGTAGGVLAFASVFTLWAFLGLLVLPTFTRRASLAVDGALIAEGVNPDALRALATELDAMQDGEPDRPGWIETIFHPIPSVTSRSDDAPPRLMHDEPLVLL
ncbi:MAG: hypothetical protein AAGH64_12770, partial [Planctomycetota bacterium]